MDNTNTEKELEHKKRQALEDLEEISEEFQFFGLDHESFYNSEEEIKLAEDWDAVQAIIDRENLSIQNLVAERDLQDLLDSHPNRDYM